MNEIETVILVSKHARINDTYATVWTNDSVVVTLLNKFKAIRLDEFNFELPLDMFLILPKQKSKGVLPKVTYPKIHILSNDNLDKETAIHFTQAERKKKILHITSEDEYFITRCKKYNLLYLNGSFVSQDCFRPFGRKAKLEDTERVARSERMREAKKIGNVKKLTNAE